MSWKFNPLTGQLDRVYIPKDLNFGKLEVVADNALVTSKTFTLDGEPIERSETLYLNGLAQDSSCYTITGTTLTLHFSFPLEVGDQVFINYVY